MILYARYNNYMIFKKLKLKNFMSYSDAEIDFFGIKTACLVGANGAGKSSLLDAITWTIWEEGRSGSDELIKLGTNEMFCEVEFFMEDSSYRIYRSRTKSFKNSQGKSNLEFQIFNSKENTWISLSRHTIKQTQELINSTLRMDHATYINSVYLKQGRADEFTLKKPKDRKQILADILGLSSYDELCELSREKAKEIDQKFALEQTLILNTKNKIANEEEFQKKHEEMSGLMKKEKDKLSQIKRNLVEKEKELNEKLEKQRQFQTLEKSITNQKHLIEGLNDQLKSTNQKIEKNKKLVENKNVIKKDYEDYVSLKSQFEILDKSRNRHLKLVEEKNKLESELKEKINQVEKELAIYKSKMDEKDNLKKELNKKLKNEDKFLNQFLPKARQEIDNFRELQEMLSQIEVEGQELKHSKEIQEIEIKQTLLSKEEIEKKINLLHSHGHDEPCPLCKGKINDKNLVVDSYKQEITFIENRLKSLILQIENLEKTILEKRKQYKEIKEKIETYSKVISKCLMELREINNLEISFKELENESAQKSINILESQIEYSKTEFYNIKTQIVSVESEIDNCKKDSSILSDLLHSGELVKELSGKLKNLELEIKDLEFNSEQFELIKKRLKENEGIQITFSLLNKAEEENQELLSENEKLSLKINTGNQEIESLSNMLLGIKDQINGMDILINEVNKIKIEESENSTNVQNVNRELAVIENSLKEINDLKEELKEKENSVKELIQNKKYYEILEKAFSKNGIQVAIIETIVPEIEKEANRILGRLTDNQMHVAFRTQKEKKSSTGLLETLDVIIADSQGTRSYELYSGGEAFKINFAIRLALSRLLTNRSGAKLQSLIIDEGFGSQDNAGKERLIEIIKSIQDEFELILIVTHLDELKDSFPAQIHVVKDEEGSKVKLVA